LRILMIGDVIGRPGREAVNRILPGLRRDLDLDLVIANGENAAGGFGLTVDTASELLDAGVDVLTSGNHIWDKREFIPYMDDAGEDGLPVARPANYPNAPGVGVIRRRGAAVVNLMGRVFMAQLDCPFRTADRLLEEIREEQDTPVIIVDFHAEATSEKYALGWFLDALRPEIPQSLLSGSGLERVLMCASALPLAATGNKHLSLLTLQIEKMRDMPVFTQKILK